MTQLAHMILKKTTLQPRSLNFFKSWIIRGKLWSAKGAFYDNEVEIDKCEYYEKQQENDDKKWVVRFPKKPSKYFAYKNISSIVHPNFLAIFILFQQDHPPIFKNVNKLGEQFAVFSLIFENISDFLFNFSQKIADFHIISRFFIQFLNEKIADFQYCPRFFIIFVENWLIPFLEENLKSWTWKNLL